MNRSFAVLLAAGAVVGVVSCTETPSGTVKPLTGATRRASLAFEPVFSADARAAATRLADFGITFDHVRIVIVRPPADTVKDTTIAFVNGQSDVTLDLTVDVHADREAFHAGIDYTNPSGVVFHGEGTVQSHPADQPAPAPQPIDVHYAGPGATVAHISLSPKTSTVFAPGSVTFTVSAFDANNATTPVPPINWTTSDPTVATISNSGTLTTTGKRGAVTITAVTPTNASDNASVTVSLPTAGIVVVSGGGQTGKVGASLGQAAVVKVVATDGVGVPNATVVFGAPAGGKASPASVLTNASGTASSTLTLGGVIGPQSFAAVVGSFNASISATATVGDPAAISPVSGGSQLDTVLHTLKAPLIVKIVDQFGNPVPDVSVDWARKTGSGAVSAASSITATDGQASIRYVLGSTAGFDTVAASVAGVTGSVFFPEQSLAGAPASIATTSGNGQSGRILTALAPFVIRVTDDNNNPVAGQTVVWTATNGTIPPTTTTDVTGTTSNVLTLGSVAGLATATATVGTKSIKFTVTVQTGLVSKLAFQTGPPASSAAAVILAPPILVALQDAGGNLTPSTNAVTIALGANPNGGTLGGTLTRNAVAGIATFDDLTLDKAGGGYTLVASSANATNAISSTLGIVAGAPALLTAVTGTAQTGTVATALSVAPSVRLTDVAGNPIAGAPVTFAAAQGSGLVQPNVAITTNAQGIATLTSWTLGTVAGAQSIVASSPGVPNLTIGATAQAGPAAQLGMFTQPSAVVTDNFAFATQPTVAVLDAFGNAVSQAGTTVTAAIATGNGTLNGTLTAVTNAQGRATFTNLRLNGLIGTRTLAFTSGGLTSVASAQVVLTFGVPVALRFTSNPTNTPAQAFMSPAVVVVIADIDGNTVSTASNTISLAITAGTGSPGAQLSGTTNALTLGGAGVFGNLSIATLGLSYSLTATAAGLTPAVSPTFDITPGLTSVQPTSVDAAFTNVPFALIGSNFALGGTTVSVTGGFVTPATFSVQGPTIITGSFNIAGGAATSTETITVTTAFGTSNGLSFVVAAPGGAPLQTGSSNGGGGGTPYSLDCPAGAVATGMNVRGGSNVDNIQVICQTITGAARTFGAPTFTAGAGGGGGSPVTLACGVNEVMVGLTGRIGNGGGGLNDQIAVICSPITGGSTSTTASVGSNFSGSIAYTAVCPTGLVVSGVQGGAGNLVDRTQIKCR